MAGSTVRIQAKSELTTRQWITVTAGLLVVVGVAVAMPRLVALEATPRTEPPIRVRNGSMNITVDQGDWEENGNAWSPSLGEASGTYTVTLELANQHTCEKPWTTATGRVIQIKFSDKTPPFVFTPSGASDRNRTLVTPRSRLTKASPTVLRYGKPGVGYIESIEVLGNGDPRRCTFTGSGQLSEIIIR